MISTIYYLFFSRFFLCCRRNSIYLCIIHNVVFIYLVVRHIHQYKPGFFILRIFILFLNLLIYIQLRCFYTGL